MSILKSKRFRDLGLDYKSALHGVQSAIKLLIERGEGRDTTPKHLRVGIDSAHISQGALIALLVDKKIITIEEYEEYLRLVANEELATREEQIEALLGIKANFR